MYSISIKKWIHKRCSGVRGGLPPVDDGFRCKRCDGTLQEADLAGDLVVAPNETYTQWGCHSGLATRCANCFDPLPLAMGYRFTIG